MTDIFSPLKLRNITLKNRIIRSATYEGYADSEGLPKPELGRLYSDLAAGGTGTIITGFAYVSKDGRAMQPAQCGIDSDAKISAWHDIVAPLKKNYSNTMLFMQIAHAGRQTRSEMTGSSAALGASSKECSYFRQKVKTLNGQGIEKIIEEFANAAHRAQNAGFDGIQIHAGHGYLIHQFLSPWTNDRTDAWADKPLFLENIILSIQDKCGKSFPLLVKLSAGEDNKPGVEIDDTIRTVKRLEKLNIDAVEISYGTMEYALNIIRGNCPLDIIFRINPIFRSLNPLMLRLWKFFFMKKYLSRLIPYEKMYNVEAAAKVKKESGIPVIAVGGIRSLENMLACLNIHNLDALALCRPLICEPDFPEKAANGLISKCSNCNLCTVYCDTKTPLHCYMNNTKREAKSD